MDNKYSAVETLLAETLDASNEKHIINYLISMQFTKKFPKIGIKNRDDISWSFALAALSSGIFSTSQKQSFLVPLLGTHDHTYEIEQIDDHIHIRTYNAANIHIESTYFGYKVSRGGRRPDFSPELRSKYVSNHYVSGEFDVYVYFLYARISKLSISKITLPFHFKPVYDEKVSYRVSECIDLYIVEIINEDDILERILHFNGGGKLAQEGVYQKDKSFGVDIKKDIVHFYEFSNSGPTTVYSILSRKLIKIKKQRLMQTSSGYILVRKSTKQINKFIDDDVDNDVVSVFFGDPKVYGDLVKDTFDKHYSYMQDGFTLPFSNDGIFKYFKL